MSIISCHGFLNYKNAAVLSSFCIKLVYYYPSKGFVLHDNNSSALNNVPQHVKQIINAEHIYKNNFLMACYIATPSADNTLKSITICSGLYT